MSGRNQRLWWGLAIIVLAVALGYCAWFARDLLGGQAQLAPGQTFTDRRGVSYTVLAREELTEMAGYTFGEDNVAAPGTVFLRYTVAIDNYSFDETDDYSTVCTFDLANTHGHFWQTRTFVDETRPASCAVDADQVTGSQLVYQVFQVPEAMLDQVAGLALTSPPRGSAPIISEAPGA